MAWSYKPLRHLLIEKDMKWIDLIEKTGINSAALTKLGRNEAVHLKVLNKICNSLDCRIEDIIVHVPDTEDSE